MQLYSLLLKFNVADLANKFEDTEVTGKTLNQSKELFIENGEAQYERMKMYPQNHATSKKLQDTFFNAKEKQRDSIETFGHAMHDLSKTTITLCTNASICIR